MDEPWDEALADPKNPKTIAKKKEVADGLKKAADSDDVADVEVKKFSEGSVVADVSFALKKVKKVGLK